MEKISEKELQDLLNQYTKELIKLESFSNDKLLQLLSKLEIEYNKLNNIVSDDLLKIKILKDKSYCFFLISYQLLKNKYEFFNTEYVEKGVNDLFIIVQLLELYVQEAKLMINIILPLIVELENISIFCKFETSEFECTKSLNEKLINIYDFCIFNQPENLTWYIRKGIAYDNIGMYGEGLKFHNKAIEMDQYLADDYKDYFENLKTKGLQEDISYIILKERKSIKTDWLIIKFSAVSGVVFLQPLPIADFFILIPIQIFMIMKIAEVYGFKLDYNMSKVLFYQLIGIVGVSFIGNHLVIGLQKAGLPGVATYINIPLIFGLTYGLGKVVDAYFNAKINNVELSDSELKNIYRESKNYGIDLMKSQKEAIITNGNYYKDTIINGVKNSKKN